MVANDLKRCPGLEASVAKDKVVFRFALRQHRVRPKHCLLHPGQGRAHYGPQTAREARAEEMSVALWGPHPAEKNRNNTWTSCGCCVLPSYLLIK